MNLNQRSNEKSRKTHKSISHKGIQKCISLNRNDVQVRDRPNRITRNPEEQIIELNKLMRGDTRISTPLNESTSDVRHNVIKRRGLSVWVHGLLYQRYTKSRGHYRRSNDILFTPYPTHHILVVGIIRVGREVQIELSNQGSRKRMIYIQKRQPTLTLKVPAEFRI